MELYTRRANGFAIVSVKGRIIRENHGELRKALEEVIRGGTRGIALDFAGVEYIDSSGLGCCAATRKLMEDRGAGGLVLFSASPHIEKMWKLIRLELVIPLFPGEKEALAGLAASAPPGPGGEGGGEGRHAVP